MHRTNGIDNRSLNVSAGFLRSFDRNFHITDVIDRIEDPDDSDTIVNGTLNLTRVCRMWQLGTDPAALGSSVPARGSTAA